MLTDLTNHLTTPFMKTNQLKSTVSSSDVGFSIESDHIAASSSSPAPTGWSSPFAATRFLPYDAPSSPLPVAFTKSTPALLFAPSLPTPASTTISDTDLRMTLEYKTVIQFGRKIMTRSKSKKIISTGADERAIPIHLPRSAKHASRLHCTVRIIAREGPSEKHKVQIKVLGQNGMRIQGKRYTKERVVTLEASPGMELDLGFWGWNARVVIGESSSHEMEEDKTMDPVIATRDDEDTSSEFDEHDPDNFATGSKEERLTKSSRHGSPAVSLLSALSSSPCRSPTREGFPSASTTRAAALVESLHLDLPGLIASAIVFHPRSTVGVEEVVRALLREVGGMWDILGNGAGMIQGEEDSEKEDSAIEEWWDLIEGVLREEAMFGCIENAGLQDAAGNTLPPAYYYLPDSDSSASRVEALEPFVKRVRGARVQAGGTRYFWRRPSMKKRW